MTPPLLRRVVVVVGCSAALTSGAWGQRWSAPSFVFARYASGSATALYAARGFGTVGGVVAMALNPSTLYRELIAGAYTQLTFGGQKLLTAVAYADATDGRYVQTYLNPTLTGGRLKFDATIEWYEPLQRSSTRQLSVNPATLLVRLERRLTVGVAATLDLARGSAPPHRIGPVAEWTAGWGTLRVEVLDRSTGQTTEVRAAVTAGF